MNLKNYIAQIPDFPKKGINFKDISPILQNPEVLAYVIDKLSENLQNIDKII
jgi:adenine phosphoribosyltransferase